LFLHPQYKIQFQKNKLNKNYNNNPKTIWNLHGTPSASPEQCQADFWSCKTVASHLLHAPPPLAARGSQKIQKQTGGSATTSSPLPFLASGENNVTCKAKQTPQTVDFILFFFASPFRSVFSGLLFFPSSDAGLLWSGE
jgi:hypothetical protein